jgi:photosystem II stability/assembly factor-like uncharacterized protein
MKLLTTIFLLSFLFCAFAQEGWQDVTPAGNYTGFVGLDVVDSENVWVVGEGGTILKTTDGGSTWNEINCPVTYNLNNVDFVNADTGMVGGHCDIDTEIMRTTNGGTSWELKHLDNMDYTIYDIEYVEGGSGESAKAYITAGLSLTWATEDVGESWGGTSIQGGCGASDIQSICFLNKNEGWFVGTPVSSTGVSIIHTTDGGMTYETQTNPTDPDIKLNSVSFADNQHGIAAGINPWILVTSDGGKNWETRSVSNYRWESVHMNPSGKAWAVGMNGIILYSTDWGNTWTTQESGVTTELWEVIFIDDNEGWIVGGGGPFTPVILHTTTGGLITDVNENNIVTEFVLHQNYPNPFNPNTNIGYQIPERSFVILKVFDALGNEIETLVNKEQEAGSYQNTFDAEGLSSGTYFYQLKAGKYLRTMKMILLK